MQMKLSFIQHWRAGVIAVLMAMVSLVSADENFTIKGTIKGVPDQKISLNMPRKGETTRQVYLTTEIVDGQFEFKGSFSNPPVMLNITFEQSNFVCWDYLVLDNSNISVSLSAGEKPEHEGSFRVFFDSVKGSELHDEYLRFKADLDQKFYSKMATILADRKKLVGYAPREEWSQAGIEKDAELRALDKQRDSYLKRSAKNHSRQLTGLLAVYELRRNQKEVAELFDGLSAPLKASQIADDHRARMNKIAERQMQAASIETGKPFKDFIQNDVNGNPVKASDLLKPGRYLFLDFWASWCAPCRAENPHLLSMYEKYHLKGFDVLAVSVDSDKDDWLEAIEEDGMPWIHVSDLKGWDNAVFNMYGLGGVPSNFLLDETGKIVASNLHGKHLEAKLAELLE